MIRQRRDFAWSADDAKQDDLWERRLRELLEWKKTLGHLRIGKAHPGDATPLEVWIFKQRRLHKRGQLDPAREEKLEAVGFEWDVRAAQWQLMFERLEGYTRAHGHCSPPRRYSGDDQLAVWVQNQRIFKRKGKLAPSRIAAMEALGFDWEPKQVVKPEDRVAELVERTGGFAAKSGTETAEWLAEQRQKMERGQLELDRADRLARIGFWKWSAKNARR